MPVELLGVAGPMRIPRTVMQKDSLPLTTPAPTMVISSSPSLANAALERVRVCDRYDGIDDDEKNVRGKFKDIFVPSTSCPPMEGVNANVTSTSLLPATRSPRAIVKNDSATLLPMCPLSRDKGFTFTSWRRV